METSSEFTSDFLSNGFHQFYSEFQDDFLVESETESQTIDANFGETVCNYQCGPFENSDCDWNPNYNQSDCLSFQSTNDSLIGNYYEADLVSSATIYSDNGTYFVNEFSINDTAVDLNNNYSMDDNTASELEFTLEHLLLDDFRLQELKPWSTIFDLPEKTLLCSDSCNLVLKESSDNLKLNSLQFNEISTTTTMTTTPLPTRIQTIRPIMENENKVFPCTFGSCEKIYSKPAHLKAHLRRHLGDKPYVCTWNDCEWKFSRSDELARHRRSHLGIKPYKCVYCPKCFARSDHLAKHRKVHERKLAATNKVKPTWISLPKPKLGRKPNMEISKNLQPAVQQQAQLCL
jgi:uncharacterized Zn-finger protein